jgi:hypothetical protein
VRSAKFIQPISQREFDLYAPSLQCGPNLGDYTFLPAWKSPRGIAMGEEKGHVQLLVGHEQVVRAIFADDDKPHRRP